MAVVVQVGPVSAGQLKLAARATTLQAVPVIIDILNSIIVTLRVSLLDAMISEPDDPQVDQVSWEDFLSYTKLI